RRVRRTGNRGGGVAKAKSNQTEIQETDSPFMFRTMLIAVMLLAGVVSAQETPRPGGPFVPAFNELRQYLSLTDAQVTSLQQVQANRRDAEAAIYRQIAEKQRTLYGLLRAGSNDAPQIGQLMIDINNLQRRIPVSAEPYRAAALAILTDQQKTKLPALVEALRLVPTAYQAVSLNLIDAPAAYIREPMPLPMPMPMPVRPAGEETDSAQP
ncbi:MAG TPA: periplasmic heavy metal sensor, partial [Bryobacteraceae bacterium]|nr:periplasmic heavy metal sensor [Bryobacteraceae bacterium]